MRYTFLLFLLANLSSFGQGVIPVIDFNNFFLSYQNGFFRNIEVQPISDFKAGDELVAYIDTRGNLRLFDGNKRTDITNLNVDYQVSDHLLGYKIGPTLNMWDQGKLSTLTYFAQDFIVKDSMIVFDDTRFNTLNVYWNDSSYMLTTYLREWNMSSVFVGENVVVFKDNGDMYKTFWNGNIYDIDVWSNQLSPSFKMGTDIMCFNDPTTQTFVVFDNGMFYDVEQLTMPKYKSGRNFIVYEDLGGNLWYYENGDKFQLSNFSADFWDVKDDIVVWSESSYFFTYCNGEKTQIENFIPSQYKIKNDVLVYQNILGGVNAFVNDEIHELTNLVDSQFEIFGNRVLVKMFNNSFIVLENGKQYTN
ncbi:hypothetical protein OAE89_00230 [Crocinitomicaceae bacterium]|nr:hypothetical protein [Crocinitomicaceae bacterium]